MWYQSCPLRSGCVCLLHVCLCFSWFVLAECLFSLPLFVLHQQAAPVERGPRKISMESIAAIEAATLRAKYKALAQKGAQRV